MIQIDELFPPGINRYYIFDKELLEVVKDDGGDILYFDRISDAFEYTSFRLINYLIIDKEQTSSSVSVQLDIHFKTIEPNDGSFFSPN